MFWSIKRRRLFYDPDKCERIISHYTGCRDIQILRALSCGELVPSDIKNYYTYGYCWDINSRHEEYVLINNIQFNRYIVDQYKYINRDSGAHHSRMKEVELQITDGKGYIIQHWVAA